MCDQGFVGSPGFKGSKGEMGYDGQRGKQGRSGRPGPDGLKGSKGAPGYAGMDGLDGLKVKMKHHKAIGHHDNAPGALDRVSREMQACPASQVCRAPPDLRASIIPTSTKLVNLDLKVCKDPSVPPVNPVAMDCPVCAAISAYADPPENPDRPDDLVRMALLVSLWEENPVTMVGTLYWILLDWFFASA